jgi:hypothetical protein
MSGDARLHCTASRKVWEFLGKSEPEFPGHWEMLSGVLWPLEPLFNELIDGKKAPVEKTTLAF